MLKILYVFAGKIRDKIRLKNDNVRVCQAAHAMNPNPHAWTLGDGSGEIWILGAMVFFATVLLGRGFLTARRPRLFMMRRCELWMAMKQGSNAVKACDRK